MSIARIAQLSKQGRGIWQILVMLQEAGYSGAQALSLLREWGLGYREQDFYRDWRILKGEIEKRAALRNVRWDRRVSEESHSVGVFKVPRNYIYTMRLEVECYWCFDPNIMSDRGVRFVTVAFDHRPTRQEACEKAKELIERKSCATEYADFCVVINCMFETAFRNTAVGE